ncbi:MAG: hypothetical protein HY744_03510 [Deltaproteobacteria bacterium]|nr:hypothetical protein [Deltaproteobacteria bacterium]
MTEQHWNAVRFDPAHAGRGHVESYFLKLNEPDGRRALWLKATILDRRGVAEPVAEAWAIAFDRQGEHVATKQIAAWREASFSREALGARVAALCFAEGHTQGAVESGGRRISWDLDFTTDAPPLVPFFHPRMYEGRLPSSKLVTPHPDSRFVGRYSVGGAEVEVEGWRGMQGHNWGRRHAELYGWAHCNQWDEGEDAVLEGVTARVKVGPVLLPPLTVLCLRHRGVRYDFNRPADILRARATITPRSWSFRAHSDLGHIEGELSAPTRDFAGLYYENPDGAMTYCLNSKIAEGRLRLALAGRAPLVLTTRAAALEIGTKDASHGVRMLV